MKNTQIVSVQAQVYETKTLVAVVSEVLDHPTTNDILVEGCQTILDTITDTLDDIWQQLENGKTPHDSKAMLPVLNVINFPVMRLQPENGVKHVVTSR